jgi:hypothetical protein
MHFQSIALTIIRTVRDFASSLWPAFYGAKNRNAP